MPLCIFFRSDLQDRNQETLRAEVQYNNVAKACQTARRSAIGAPLNDIVNLLPQLRPSCFSVLILCTRAHLSS